MRPANLDIDEIVHKLNGSSDSLEKVCEDLYGEEFDWMRDLTEGEIASIDDQIFRCAECDWWYEVSELSEEDDSENYCINCRPEKD